MQVNEQIEALETMGINPVRFLIVPKTISLFFMLPCLTVIGDVVGMLGGYLVGVSRSPHAGKAVEAALRAAPGLAGSAFSVHACGVDARGLVLTVGEVEEALL